MEAAAPRSLAQAKQQLVEALDAINSVSLSTLSADELCDWVCELASLQARVDAVSCSAVTAADQRCLAQAYGLRKTSQLVASRTNADPAQVRGDGRLGNWLVDFAEFTDAFAAGVMLRWHLEMIRKTLDNPRTHFTLINNQARFVQAARDCSFAGFEQVVAYWLVAADPDGDLPRDQLAKSGFTATKRTDGTVAVKGDLDPLAGAAFMTAYQTETQKVFRADTETGTVRPSRNRGLQALMNLIVRGAARADGTQPEPLINVVMSEKVAEDSLARIDEPSVESLPVAHDDIDGRCELIDGTPIHPHYALAVMGLATFRRQIMNATSRILDVSTNTRCFTKWQKNTLLVAARGKCQTPGCDAPFAWLQADHIQPHSRGGPTSIHNGQILCDPDNKHKRDKHAA